MILNNKLQGFVGKSIKLDFQILNEDGTYYDLNDVDDAFIKIYSDGVGENDEIIQKEMDMPAETKDRGLCSVLIDNTEMDVSAQTYHFKLVFNFTADDSRVLGFGEFKIIGDDEERIQQIKKLYGLDYDYYTLSSALNWARDQTKNNAFENVITEKGSISDNIKICSYVVDVTNDGVVDVNDFKVLQYTTNSPYNSEDITSNIVSIQLDNPNGFGVITFDGEYPEPNFNKLKIEYCRASKPYNMVKQDIMLLEEYYVLYRLFDVLEPHKLQHGMTSKSLNGVNIDFNQESVTQIMTKLKTKIQNQKLKIYPFTKCEFNTHGKGGLTRSVLIPKSY